MTKRSNCPISNVLDKVGDKWSLLILRDLLFFKKRSYSDFQNSDEQVATNILSNRLQQLEQYQLITREPDDSDRRKKVYSLTRAGRDMRPIILEMIVWSSKYDPATDAPQELVTRIQTDRDNLINELLTTID